MSYNQSPPPQPPFTGPGFPPASGPKWAKKRFVIPAAFVILFVGVGIGSSGGDEEKTSADAKPQPTVTVTEAAAAKGEKAKPAPTVTVTKTSKPKAATPAEKPAADKAATGKVVFKVWGSAPAGVNTTYGSDSDNRDGSGLPMTKTLSLNDDALYFHISAQLQGGGDINCSVTVGDETKKGHASGSYNICTAQLNSGLMGGWD
ncbi:hypothetical protein ACIRF8_20615 [Streptomyces sp. NPDC102406]|uniref:hypothetical protein n=1 Tax=Streptomyces sp. NPDC102406 TaxID=3366171 RepID=UPI0038216A57